MHVLRKIAVSLVTATMLAIPTASAANAAEAPSASTSAARWPSDRWSPPFASRSDCLVVQNEYRRYYKITSACDWYEAYMNFFFTYNQR
jgi:hypothetical protein